METSLSDLAYNKLNKIQRILLDECVAKQNGGLSLPMGSGKTLLSLAVAFKQSNESILVVASKTLVSSWITEIEKFFGGSLTYEIVSPSHTKNITKWTMNENTRVVIVTPSILSRTFTKHNLLSSIITSHRNNRNQQEHWYNTVSDPVMDSTFGVESIFSRIWGTLIVDEAQEYSNIKSSICRALCAIAAIHRWALSGTLITNPKPERILGYYCIIDYDCPRTLNGIKDYVSDRNYEGIKKSTIMRDKRTIKYEIEVVNKIVSHSMYPEEKKIYLLFKNMVTNINARIKAMKVERIVRPNSYKGDEIRKLSSGLLAMLTYLRQSITTPILPIASITLKMADYKRKDVLANFLNKEIEKLKLEKWLNTEDSIRSSRIETVLKTLEKHKDERVIMFVSYRTSVNIFEHFITDRPFFTLEQTMNIETRKITLNKFEDTKNGVLVLTYALGSTGLNLQKSRICFLVELEWSAHVARQALARLVRIGQESKKVYAYYFTSNTGIESGVLTKQMQKERLVTSITHGATNIELKTSNIKKYISLLVSIEDNITTLDTLYIEK